MFAIQLVVLAFVQGLTEFLPISSSGHLILMPHLTGWQDQGLSYDIAAHFGTLIAVLAYFRADLFTMTRHWLRHVQGGPATPESRLAWAVGWATLPVALIGLAAHDLIAIHLRTPMLIACTTIGFGLVLWATDVGGRRERDLDTITWRDVAVVGFAQALALIPGTSRSGITMSAGLALGLTRDAAARFSFLLAVPVILLATAYETWSLIGAGMAVDWRGLVLVTVVAAATAFGCIAIFLSVLERIGMLPFVLYRMALGVVLLWLFV